MSIDHRPPALVRYGPTSRPMVLPMPALVVITDTNALAGRACNAAGASGVEELFVGLATTGRSNTYVSAHVPGELDDHLGDVTATNQNLVLADVERVLWGQVMPKVPVVDLAMGDYLHPRIRPLLRADPEFPKRLWGDPDDVGTAALAEFLAPAVILSADSVFARFGLASTLADTWVPTAYSMLRAAGFEATLSDAALVAEYAGRLLFAAGGVAVQMGRRYPLPTRALLGGAVFLAWQTGYLSSDRWRSGVRRLGEKAGLWVNKLSGAFERHQRARGALLVVEPYGLPTVEQLAGRYLARCGRQLTLLELGDALNLAGYEVTADELEQAVHAHPAFVVGTDHTYTVGRRVLRALPTA